MLANTDAVITGSKQELMVGETTGYPLAVLLSAGDRVVGHDLLRKPFRLGCSPCDSAQVNECKAVECANLALTNLDL